VIIINLNIKEESKKERNTKLFSKKHHNGNKEFSARKITLSHLNLIIQWRKVYNRKMEIRHFVNRGFHEIRSTISLIHII